MLQTPLKIYLRCSMKNKTTIVWFRKDLRIQDHPALWEASQQGTIIPVFIWSPDEEIYDQLAELSLLPKQQWYQKFSHYWTPGEIGARKPIPII